MDDIRPIKTEADYNWALAEIAQYFENEPEPGSPDGDRFDVLSALIGVYEEAHWRIEAPDPVETIKSYMETTERTQADLAKVLGSRSRASEVLGRNRRLTLEMIYELSKGWKIPADLLVKPYHLKKAVIVKRTVKAGKAKRKHTHTQAA